MSSEELLRALVAIDSVNPDLVPGGAGEGEIAAFVAGWLRDAGLEVHVEEAAPGRPNVIGVARGSGGGRSLMLNAHMDTVTTAGMERPLEPTVRDGRMYGRGTYDMKAGLAAAMIAAAGARDAALRGDVIVAAVVDEEYASVGASALVERFSADAAIVTEPTELRVCVAHKGFAWLEVEVRGRAAHGSRPDLGVDAIAKMGRVLVGLEELQARLDGTRHPLLGPGSVHASLIDGGQELSSYPERCLLTLERRTLPGETPDAVRAEIEALAADLDAEVRPGLVRHPFEVAQDAPVVAALCRQAEAAAGAPPEIMGHAGWMDAAILSAAGIPTVVFGPGGEGAHATVEWVTLADVDRCADVLLATARELCA